MNNSIIKAPIGRIEDYNKTLPVIELYTCIQSEGSRSGRPTVAIRTTGCTHRCFVDVPGRRNPKVYKVDGKAIDLREVGIGDKLMAWNSETLSIAETEVVSTEINQVQTYCQVKTDNGTFVVTPEHPFMTTRGWMFATDLTDSDELVHFSGRQRNSYRMQKSNPMKQAHVVEKVHNHANYLNFSNDNHREKSNQTRTNKYKSLNPRAPWTEEKTQDFHKRASIRMQKDNPMYNPESLAASIEKRKNLGWGFKGGMSKVEDQFWKWLQESELRDLFWFTGDGGFTVKYKGTLKVPDFKLHGENYFLEVGVETGPKGFRPNWNKYAKEVDDIYSNCCLKDAKVLAINIADGKEECLRKVRRFITNGIKVLSVRTITSKKTYNTYNLHCAPFDNFLVKTSDSSCQSVVSHNCFFGEGGWCDSWYTSIHPEKGKYTFQDIINIYNQNPEIKEMMLTGGSPTMHPTLVNELTHFANERQIIITIETEGSHYLETDYPINLISFSPKFSNSVPVIGTTTPLGSIVTQKLIDTHNRYRLNKEAIKKSMEYHSDYHMKVVANPVEDPSTWDEIKAFLDELEVPKHKIWIMPPGDNREELIRVYPMVIDWCTKNYYNFTGREHIIAFDTKREV